MFLEVSLNGDYFVAEVKLSVWVLPSTFIKTWKTIQANLVNIFVYFYHYQYSASHKFWYKHHWVFF